MTQVPDPASPAPETDDEGGWRTSLLVPVLIVAIAAGLIGAIVVVSRGEQDAGQQALAATTVDASALPVTVPYREVAGYPVIDVTLGDGSRTVPMILDTGAPTVVSEAVADVFGEWLGGHDLHGLGGRPGLHQRDRDAAAPVHRRRRVQ